MSKSSKSVREAGREGKRNQDKEPPIFCEACLFVFQGELEFKSHACFKKATTVSETWNKKNAKGFNTQKERQTQNKVIIVHTFPLSVSKELIKIQFLLFK